MFSGVANSVSIGLEECNFGHIIDELSLHLLGVFVCVILEGRREGNK